MNRTILDSQTINCIRTINKITKHLNIKYFIIGALAKDIIFSMLYNITKDRLTRDLDISVMVSSWKSYDKLIEQLLATKQFKKDSKQKHKLHYLSQNGLSFPVDIIPFGKNIETNNQIIWPQEEGTAMSSAGFDEAYNNSLNIEINPDLKFKVVNHPGLFTLKLITWSERFGGKDAQDMRYIIEHYIDICSIDRYYDILEKQPEHEDDLLISISLLAEDIKKQYPKTKDIIHDILEENIKGSNQLASTMLKILDDVEELDRIIAALENLKDQLK